MTEELYDDWVLPIWKYYIDEKGFSLIAKTDTIEFI